MIGTDYPDRGNKTSSHVASADRVWGATRTPRRHTPHSDFFEPLDLFVEFERRDQIVVMVRQRICDRALVAMIRRQMKDVLELIMKPAKRRSVCNRALYKLEARVLGQVAGLGGKQIIHYHDAVNSVPEQTANEVASYKAGPAHHRPRVSQFLATKYRLSGVARFLPSRNLRSMFV